MNSWADILGDMSAMEAYRLYLADLIVTNETPAQWLERQAVKMGMATYEDADWAMLGNDFVQAAVDEIAGYEKPLGQ
jgi:hypothetical protein